MSIKNVCVVYVLECSDEAISVVFYRCRLPGNGRTDLCTYPTRDPLCTHVFQIGTNKLVCHKFYSWFFVGTTVVKPWSHRNVIRSRPPAYTFENNVFYFFRPAHYFITEARRKRTNVLVRKTISSRRFVSVCFSVRVFIGSTTKHTKNRRPLLGDNAFCLVRLRARTMLGLWVYDGRVE